MTRRRRRAQREKSRSFAHLLRSCRARVCSQCRTVICRVFFGLLSAFAFPLRGLAGETAPLVRYEHVEIAPAKTSIYIGSVTMTMPTFARTKGVYEATYTAKVFPFFFYNETGRLYVEVSDEQLRRLEHGEAIDFIGRGVRDDGVERRVEGRATPTDANGGKLKVRVFVSRRVELIFNTTYRFAPAA